MKLFHRSPKSVTLTPAGRRFHMTAQEFLGACNKVKAELRASVADRPLRIGVLRRLPSAQLAPTKCSSWPRGISWPALNQIVCALCFFYDVTLRQSELPERIPYAREPRKLPLVLSADEVVRFLRYPFEKLDLTHDFSFACRRRHCSGPDLMNEVADLPRADRRP